jgi:PAS domain S-box-containing protein
MAGTNKTSAELEAELADLRRRAQRYHSLFEHASDGIFISGPGSRLVEVNARACEMTGYTADELRALGARDLFSVAARRRLPDDWPVVEDGETLRYEDELRRKDGTTFLAEVSLRRIDAETVEAIVRDVTVHRQMEEVMHRYAERLVSLHKLDQAILSAQSSHAVAEAAIESLRQFIPCDRIRVLVFDAATGEAELLAASFGGAARPAAGPVADAVRRGEIHPVRDLRLFAGEDWAAPLLAAGFRSMLDVPLVSRDQVTGVLNMLARRSDAFTVEHVDVARETAVQVSLAIQSARLFEEVLAARERLEQLSRRLVQVQEEERRYLALELHDEIGQVLTALRLSLDVEDPALPEPARERLDKAKRIVEVLTAKVRNLSLDLRPTLLDDLGLLPALLWYLRRYTEQTGVRVDFRHAGLSGRRFPYETETAAYRIVQEALTNVARHAGVPDVGVQAWVHEGGLHLQVEDAGRGFALRGEPAASSGLSGMRERARLAGGELTITTEPGEGVQVQAVLPIGAPV